MVPRKRDAEATRTAILDAAEQLFIQKGFAEVALSQIAKAASVTKSLIHHHFGSKESLCTAVKMRYYEEYALSQKGLFESEPPSLAFLVKSMIGYFRYLQSKPDFTRMKGMMLLDDQHDCEEMFIPLVEMGTAALRECQKNGEIRADISPDHILISILAMIENWFLCKDYVRRTHYRHIPDEDYNQQAQDEAYLESMLRIYLEGIVQPGFKPQFSLNELTHPS